MNGKNTEIKYHLDSTSRNNANIQYKYSFSENHSSSSIKSSPSTGDIEQVTLKAYWNILFPFDATLIIRKKKIPTHFSWDLVA